jgi:hypothetical protein
MRHGAFQIIEHAQKIAGDVFPAKFAGILKFFK